MLGRNRVSVYVCSNGKHDELSSMGEHGIFTVIIVTPYHSFSLAAGFFVEIVRARLTGVKNVRLLVRNYSRCFTEVDISFVRDILLFKPDVIGFSCFFWNLEQNLKLAELAKSLHSDTMTVFGGPQMGTVDEARELVGKHRSIDAILCGEADFAFPELVYRIVCGDETRDIAGLVTRNGDDIRTENGPCFVEDLGTLPLVFHEGSEYVAKHLCAKDVMPLQTLRGCRQNCSYCLYATGGVRLFPLDRVEKELAFLCHQRVRHVRICDSHFGGSKARAMELFSIIRHLNTQTTFYVYPDPRHVDRAYVQAAQNANCKTVSLGVETADPSVSTAVHRRFDAEEFRHAFVALRDGGETPQVDMMFGLPKQTTQSYCSDLVRLRLDSADKVLFSPLMVFPGTNLARHAEAKKVSILDTPQRYGFSSSLGKAEYASLIMMTESYRLLSMLHRTDWYIRSAFNCDSRYAKSLGSWFYASVGACRRDVLELRDALQASAAYIRAYAKRLTEEVVVLLAKAIGRELPELEFLSEIVRMDILEVAMKRRKDELARDILPELGGPHVFFLDEVVRQQWVLGQDAWLECHAVPHAIACKGESKPPEEDGNELFCVYLCPECTIFFVDSREFAFLERFSRPSYIFDAEIEYTRNA